MNIGRCSGCGLALRSPTTSVRCPKGCRSSVALHPIKHVRHGNMTKCGAACKNGQGRVCDCECGGRNHGVKTGYYVHGNAARAAQPVFKREMNRIGDDAIFEPVRSGHGDVIGSFKPGDRVFFEYHCLQSDESCDAALWRHTRQYAKIERVLGPPEIDEEVAPMYALVFKDGFRGQAMSDEVTKRPRPNPEERGVVVPSARHGNVSSLEKRAAIFAAAAHKRVGQKRKYTGKPYIVHPAAVVKLVKSVPHTEEQVAAAWLHDTVEDTGTKIEEIEAEFGPLVASYVGWLSDVSKPGDGDRAARKAIDLAHTARAPAAVHTVKLADLINNSESIIQHDFKFAATYLAEKQALLEVLRDGDPTLYAKAQALAMSLPVVRVAAGSHLYHGTSSSGFAWPRGPAWFTENRDAARAYTTGPSAHKHPKPKILDYKAARELRLLDVTELSVRHRVARICLGREQATEPELAAALCHKGGFDGWIHYGHLLGGQNDVMICNPKVALVPVSP